MKNQTNRKLLLSLVLCSLGFAAFGLRSANSSQNEIQANKPSQLGYGCTLHPPQSDQVNKPSQLGYGRAPHPPQSGQANKPSQLGYGRAPHPPQSDQANKPSQLGYGHAPHPPQSEIRANTAQPTRLGTGSTPTSIGLRQRQNEEQDCLGSR